MEHDRVASFRHTIKTYGCVRRRWGADASSAALLPWNRGRFLFLCTAMRNVQILRFAQNDTFYLVVILSEAAFRLSGAKDLYALICLSPCVKRATSSVICLRKCHLPLKGKAWASAQRFPGHESMGREIV